MHQLAKTYPLIAAAGLLFAWIPAGADHSRSIPSVVVTVENAAPSRGALQTPVWIGIHNGTFDLYDRGVALGAGGLVPGPAVERLAEDGTTAPLSEQFAIAQSTSPQATLFGPAGPLTPGDRSSTTLNVDPANDRYFSYASMVIPSNDAFIANGNPTAHELFDQNGRFVGGGFAVPGSAVLDAGTELNDEASGNTAFLNQAAPNTGDTENGVVDSHPGFRLDLAYPDGVLNHPVFGLADFTAPNYRAANFSFRYVDLGRTVFFRSNVTPGQEVTASPIDSRGSGRAFALARNGEKVILHIHFRGLTGDVAAAHLHNGARGVNGPVVVDLSSDVRGNRIRATIKAGDVTGPLGSATDPMLALLNELAAGNIYINIHTAANPGGEIRGQVDLLF